MFVDALGLVSDAQAVSATGVSTNTIDLGSATIARRVGTGEAMGFGVNVDVAADGTTGDETYTFEIIQSASADLSNPTVLASRAIAAATLVAGFRFFLDLPQGTPTARYLGMRYTLAGTTPSITVTSHFTARSLFSLEPQAYAKGYSN